MRIRRSRIGAAAATALLFGFASQAVHLVGAAHEVCREHGDLVERAAVDGLPASYRATGVPAQSAAHPAPRAGAHRHDHCLTALSDDDAAIQREVAPTLLAVPTAVAMQAAPDGARRPSLRRYRLAPKTSPPA